MFCLLLSSRMTSVAVLAVLLTTTSLFPVRITVRLSAVMSFRIEIRVRALVLPAWKILIGMDSA